MPLEDLYEDHVDLLRNRAWKWAKSTGREFSDCMSVCHEAFMDSVRIFEDDRGSRFSSVLATKCNQKLSTFVRKCDLPSAKLWDPDACVGPDRFSATIRWNEIHEALSSEARAVCDILLGETRELFGCVVVNDTTGKTAEHAAELLLWRHGYTRSMLRPIFLEIKRELRSASC